MSVTLGTQTVASVRTVTASIVALSAVLAGTVEACSFAALQAGVVRSQPWDLDQEALEHSFDAEVDHADADAENPDCHACGSLTAADRLAASGRFFAARSVPEGAHSRPGASCIRGPPAHA